MEGDDINFNGFQTGSDPRSPIEIAPQTELDSTLDLPKKLQQGDKVLNGIESETNLILHNLIHLPEKEPSVHGNAEDRLINGLLKTGALVVAAIGVKAGLDTDNVSLMGEGIVAATSIGLLGTSILQGMLANLKSRRLGRIQSSIQQLEGDGVDNE